jgi:hypothetical protein
VPAGSALAIQHFERMSGVTDVGVRSHM